MSSLELVRLRIDDGKVADEERVPLPERIRDVGQGPDGNVYVLAARKQTTGNIWQLSPLT